MSAFVEYTYANGDLLDKPNTYFYSAYQGEGFVSAWSKSRAECFSACSTVNASDHQSTRDQNTADVSSTARYFKKLASLFAANCPAGDRRNLDAIVRNFEAKKRIYRDYNPGFTSKDRTDYSELGLYVDFAELMVVAYQEWQELPYLNALIKCMDILCAHRTDIPDSEKLKMRNLINAETKYVGQLAQRLELNKS